MADSRRSKASRGSLLSVLDIGSSKTTCLIVRMLPDAQNQFLYGRTHESEVIGIGHTRSTGMKSGTIVDLDAIEKSVRYAVEAAEKMAGVTVDSLVVNLTAGRLSSTNSSAKIGLDPDKPVSRADLDHVLRAALAHSARRDRHILHLLPVSYTLDGQKGIDDPIGMVGEELHLNMHCLTADHAPMRNMEAVLNRAHLAVETMVAAPYASGLSTLVDDELELGCACVDMGAGTTTVGVFHERKFVHCDAIAIGGHHITLDLARAFSCSIEDAERLKTRSGSVLLASSDDNDLISISPLGDGTEQQQIYQVPRSIVNRIIRARVEETLELLRDRLNSSGFSSIVGKRVILTGGAAQMSGLSDLARQILGRNVRIGRPLGVRGLPIEAKGTAFAAAVGLLVYPQCSEADYGNAGIYGSASAHAATGTHGAMGRVAAWLRESF
ncbi:MAG: cell division protein FtsA [Pseudomonadota bacterium]